MYTCALLNYIGHSVHQDYPNITSQITTDKDVTTIICLYRYLHQQSSRYYM